LPPFCQLHGVLGSKSRSLEMEIARNVKRQAWYLSKYLSKADFERYYFSDGWVFPGWIGFSQWFKKEFGDYPQREMLVEIGRMSKGEREEHTRFGVYLWETRKQNVA
jgi:hypothetical protein